MVTVSEITMRNQEMLHSAKISSSMSFWGEPVVAQRNVVCFLRLDRNRDFFFFEEKYPAKDKTKGLTIVIITKLDQLQIVSQKLFGLVDLNLVLRYPTTCDS